MLLTEKQANTKWCPHARYSRRNNPETAINISTKCQASGCTSWRWRDIDVVPISAGGNYYEYSANEPVKPPRGYCGLAGKP